MEILLPKGILVALVMRPLADMLQILDTQLVLDTQIVLDTQQILDILQILVILRTPDIPQVPVLHQAWVTLLVQDSTNSTHKHLGCQVHLVKVSLVGEVVLLD